MAVSWLGSNDLVSKLEAGGWRSEGKSALEIESWKMSKKADVETTCGHMGGE